MRLRPLSEAECYARCYGGRSYGGRADERVSLVRVLPSNAPYVTAGERVRELFEERLDARGPEAEAA